MPVTLPPETKYVDGCNGLELATIPARNVSGPFIHRPGDDDSAAVTFWGKKDLRKLLLKAITILDQHYAERGEHEFS